MILQRPPAICLESVVASHGDGFVLGPITWSVKEDGCNVILGPSGSGKSTLLRLVAGLLRPDQGRVEVTTEGGHEISGSRMSMVFQDYILYPHLSILENAVLPFQVPVNRRAERRRLVQELSPRLGMAHLLGRMPHELSGGERQRAAVLKVLVSGAPLWLMDEPLANLDKRIRLAVRSVIAERRRQCRAILLYVTHDLNDALALADELIVMKEGRLLQTGDVEKLLHHPNCIDVARFLWDPPPNELRGWFRTTGSKAEAVLESGQVFALPTPFEFEKAGEPLIALSSAEDAKMAGAASAKETGLLRLPGVVVIIERGARRHLVEFETELGRLRAFCSADQGVNLGDTIQVDIPTSAMVIFRASDGVRVR